MKNAQNYCNKGNRLNCKDNLDNAVCETRRTFWNKKWEYQKEKINELETNSNNKNIINLHRGINEFKKGYQPRINIVKDEISDQLADSHNILKQMEEILLSATE
jgi:hypothetical protein